MNIPTYVMALESIFINDVKIGAITVKIGENAVANEFLSRVRADISILIEALVSFEYFERLLIPSPIPLVTRDNALNTVLNMRDITSIRPILMDVLFADLSALAIATIIFLIAETTLPNPFLAVLPAIRPIFFNPENTRCCVLTDLSDSCVYWRT